LNHIVGFTVYSGIPDIDLHRAKTAQNRALNEFSWLNTRSISIGEAQVDIWGHHDISNCTHRLSDGDQLFLIGSPAEQISWEEVEKLLSFAKRSEDFTIPWNGRVILIRISADGKRWTLWNDWLGSIPVFYAQSRGGRIASTIEPVVVAAEGYGPSDVFMPGLVSLFIEGHLIGDWTLYKGMKVVPPDCAAEWNERGFHWKQNFTVEPSQELWQEGWDELVDQMYELSRQAIADVLKTQSSWIVPLSGGLDSRLIVGVGAQLGVDLHTFTWGKSKSLDASAAQQVAKVLDLPWKLIEFDTEYLTKYTPLWSHLFGSAMAFHGIYLMPFLDAMHPEPPGQIVLGFIGEGLAGYAVRFQTLFHSTSKRIYQLRPDGYGHYPLKDFQDLFKIPMEDALEEFASEIQKQSNAVPGALFQRLGFLTFWSRQHMFTNFQSTLCDYWRGVATPYLNRAYARFCYALPRAVREDRRLQVDVFRRYFPKLAAIRGTYGPAPYTLTENYVLKRRFAMALPWPLRQGPLKEFRIFGNPRTWDQDCIRADGWTALWPIRDAWEELSEWIHMDKVLEAYQETVAGDTNAKGKLRPIQMLAYRLLEK
jgi:hypothetical protein